MGSQGGAKRRALPSALAPGKTSTQYHSQKPKRRQCRFNRCARGALGALKGVASAAQRATQGNSSKPNAQPQSPECGFAAAATIAAVALCRCSTLCSHGFRGPCGIGMRGPENMGKEAERARGPRSRHRRRQAERYLSAGGALGAPRPARRCRRPSRTGPSRWAAPMQLTGLGLVGTHARERRRVLTPR